MKQETKEALSEFIGFKITPTMKNQLKALADKDEREFSDYIRLQWKKLIAKEKVRLILC